MNFESAALGMIVGIIVSSAIWWTIYEDLVKRHHDFVQSILNIKREDI